MVERNYEGHLLHCGIHAAIFVAIGQEGDLAFSYGSQDDEIRFVSLDCIRHFRSNVQVLRLQRNNGYNNIYVVMSSGGCLMVQGPYACQHQ